MNLLQVCLMNRSSVDWLIQASIWGLTTEFDVIYIFSLTNVDAQFVGTVQSHGLLLIYLSLQLTNPVFKLGQLQSKTQLGIR